MSHLHLLVQRDGIPARAVRVREFPLRIGAGADCQLRLEDAGLPALHGELTRSPRGTLRYRSAGDDGLVRLEDGACLQVGPYALFPVELPGQDPASSLTPLLELVPALWQAREDDLPVAPLLQALRSLFGARWGAVVRCSEGEEVEVLHAAGERPPGCGQAVSRTVLERLQRAEEPVLQVMVGGDEELQGAASIPPEVRAVIAGELRHGDQLEGVVYLENPVSGHEFTPTEGLLLRRLAAFAGEVLARARRARGLDRRVQLLEKEQRRLRRLVQEGGGETTLVGSSGAMSDLEELIEKAAGADVTVLIEGESGTGKELVARALHRRSARAEEPFVAVNCAAIPGELVESELFGHVEGAFTGAVRDRLGRFELAHGGTLFLDELGELPPEAQAKLLRALEERRVQPVGAPAEVPVDVRVVAATHMDLEAAIEAGRFREDLFYRVAVFRIRVPPLRDRLEDLPELAERFVGHLARTHGRPARGLTEGALEVLRRHRWPGNVRELRNLLEAAVIRADGARIRPADMTILAPRPGGDLEVPEPMDLAEARARFEKAFLARALTEARGDMQAVRKQLGISQTTLYDKCKELGLRPADFRR